jgi:hypothetical protein
VDERADGVHLSYDRMASLLAPYNNRDALEVARDWIEKSRIFYDMPQLEQGERNKVPKVGHTEAIANP